MNAARLLFVSGEYPPDIGGVGDYTARLRSALDERRWSSGVLTRRQVKRWDARALVRLLRVAPRSGIVHIQFQAGAFDLLGDVCLMPLVLRRLRPRVKVVTTFHDTRVPYLFPRAGGLRERAVRLLARSSDAVIAADADDLAALSGPSPRHHHIPIGTNIANAPPPGYDRATFRAWLGLPPEALVLAYFGLRNASKGLDLLFDTFDRVLATRPDARLLMLGGEVGASDPTDRLTAARVEARLARSRVIQTAWLPPPQLSAYLLAADIALLPYADGASARRGALLACAAHNLPIVSTLPATPDVADFIAASPADPAALSAAIDRIHRDPIQSGSLRAAASRLSQKTAWPQIAARHVAIYEELSRPG
ncbi:MAG TPA: glycosyltransferase [Chloroflexota bacterium]|nr:glycosyltransferase [Chloroflexota bacterium]